MAEYVLGMKAGAYWAVPGTAQTAIGSMTELTNIDGIKISNSAGTADVTTRANNGYRATAPTLKECTLEFTLLWKPGDTGFDAIKDAYDDSETIEIAICDQKRDVTGAKYFSGTWSIISFDIDQSNEEAIKVSVSASLCTKYGWFTISGS